MGDATENKFKCLRSRLHELLTDVARAEKERDHYRETTRRLEDRMASLEGEVYFPSARRSRGSSVGDWSTATPHSVPRTMSPRSPAPRPPAVPPTPQECRPAVPALPTLRSVAAVMAASQQGLSTALAFMLCVPTAPPRTKALPTLPRPLTTDQVVHGGDPPCPDAPTAWSLSTSSFPPTSPSEVTPAATPTEGYAAGAAPPEPSPSPPPAPRMPQRAPPPPPERASKTVRIHGGSEVQQAAAMPLPRRRGMLRSRSLDVGSVEREVKSARGQSWDRASMVFSPVAKAGGWGAGWERCISVERELVEARTHALQQEQMRHAEVARLRLELEEAKEQGAHEREERDEQVARLRRKAADRDSEVGALRAEVQRLLSEDSADAAGPLRDWEMKRLRRELLEARNVSAEMEAETLALRQRADADRGELDRLRQRLLGAHTLTEGHQHSQQAPAGDAVLPSSSREVVRLRRELEAAKAQSAQERQQQDDLRRALQMTQLQGQRLQHALAEEKEAARRCAEEIDTLQERAAADAKTIGMLRADCAAGEERVRTRERDMTAASEMTRLRRAAADDRAETAELKHQVRSLEERVRGKDAELQSLQRTVDDSLAARHNDARHAAALEEKLAAVTAREASATRRVDAAERAAKESAARAAALRDEAQRHDATPLRVQAAEAVRRADAQERAAGEWARRAESAVKENTELRRALAAERKQHVDQGAVTAELTDLKSAMAHSVRAADRHKAEAAQLAHELSSANAALKAHRERDEQEDAAMRQEVTALRALNARLSEDLDRAAQETEKYHAQRPAAELAQERCSGLAADLVAEQDQADILRKRVAALERHAFEQHHCDPEAGADGDAAAVGGLSGSGQLSSLHAQMAEALAEWNRHGVHRDAAFDASHKRRLTAMLGIASGIQAAVEV
eukprot:TRINITY_DN5630_c0_g4_i1.p1 TRINITY_DN5630_c0_g4~~TRINITY_DN5630_c0_g4_i1.p1  ORF type:complete len:956 (+),score=238.44 TRINITY_DN5630_c0_g4_i1:121-2868(+)